MNGVAETYAYDAGDKLQSVSVGGNVVKSYGYDAAGRTISVTSSAGTTNLTYDFESRVTQISGPGISATYSYNGISTRTSALVGGIQTIYRREGAGNTTNLIGYGSSSITPSVSVRSSGTTSYLHSEMKSLDSVTGSSQSIIATQRYDAFGNFISGTGVWPTILGYGGAFGYQSDTSGLKQLGYRTYDPSTGRFLTRDPIKDGRNWFAYGAWEASPTTTADPTGLMSLKSPAGAGTAAKSMKIIWGGVIPQAGSKAGRELIEFTIEEALSLGIDAAIRLVEVGGGDPANWANRPDTAHDGQPMKPGMVGGSGAGKVFSESVRQQALMEHGSRGCVYCSNKFGPMEVDHIIPKSLGGSNTIENAQVTCRSCNRSKGKRSAPKFWLESLGDIIRRGR
mgnify:CR=1 FL=1